MNEILVGISQQESELLVDINFENRPVGSKGLFDYGSRGITFSRRDSGTVHNDGVIDHPQFGKCYNFDGAVSFLGNKTPGLVDTPSDYEVEIAFVPMASPSYMTLAFCGGFSAGVPGWNHYIQPQNRAAYNVLFVIQHNGTGGFQSIQHNLPASVALTGALITNKIKVIKANNRWSIQNSESPTDVGAIFKLQTESAFTIGADSSPPTGGIFTGYLKHLKIKKL